MTVLQLLLVLSSGRPTRYAYACLGAEARGADVEPIEREGEEA